MTSQVAIQQEQVRERAAEQPRGDCRNCIRQYQERQRPPWQFATQEQDGEDREEEHGLHFERERYAGEEHAPGRALRLEAGERCDEHRDVDCVALGPGRAIKDDRRRKQDQRERHQLPASADSAVPNDQDRCECEDDVEYEGDAFDRYERRDRENRASREEVMVERRIVREARGEGTGAALSMRT